MTTVQLTTEIRAPRERCFDLARDVDLHLHSMSPSGEQAVGGRTTGLLGLGEEVTWRARHFGIMHLHRSRITVFDPPSHFRDSMVAGRFKTFEHDHFFEHANGVTRMRDLLQFESPLGALGRIVDHLLLARYLTRLLAERNRVIKAVAERDMERAGERAEAADPRG